MQFSNAEAPGSIDPRSVFLKNAAGAVVIDANRLKTESGS